MGNRALIQKITFGVLICGLLISTSHAINIHRIFTDDGLEFDEFGKSVAIDGEWIAVGAHYDNSVQIHTGSVYFYKNSGSGWSYMDEVRGTETTSYDDFGHSVDMAGTYTLIGSPDDQNNGTAYLFARLFDTWLEVEYLYPVDPTSEDRFGNSVGIQSDWAVIGAPNTSDGLWDTGGVYMFEQAAGWTYSQKLYASDKAEFDGFGYDVSIDGSYVFVGSPYDDYDSKLNAGSAYIFWRNGNVWSEWTKLTPVGGGSEDLYGYSVDVKGDYAIIGCPFDDDLGEDSGSAYIYKNNLLIWQFEAKLLAEDGGYEDNFGWSVAIDGDYALVGAAGASHSYIDYGGAVYIFHNDGTSWNQAWKLSGTSDGDWLGSSVNLDGDQGIGGAPGWNNFYEVPDVVNAGAVYVFNDLTPPTPTPTGTPCPHQEKMIIASDGVSNDIFGRSVDTDGLYVYAGSAADTGEADSGAVYVYTQLLQTWIEIEKLSPVPPESSQQFGNSLAADGNYLIIGSQYKDHPSYNSAGAVYVYEKDGWDWNEVGVRYALDPYNGDYFGMNVDIHGDWAIAGAPLDDDTYDGSGSAYILWRGMGAWTTAKKLVADDPESNDNFGYSVAIHGDRAVAGAKNGNLGSWNSGAAYVFERSGTDWFQTAKLTPSGAAEDDYFGHSIDMDGDRIVVGAPGEDTMGDLAGAAYCYHWNGTGWDETAKLIASDGGHDHEFGSDVAINGDYIIVGAQKANNSGTAYVFEYNGMDWSELEILTACYPETGDRYGAKVSIAGDLAAVGAYDDHNANGMDAGAVYLYDYFFPPPPTSTPTMVPTSTSTPTPSNTPTQGPTSTPTEVPTGTATKIPTDTPTQAPTSTPECLNTGDVDASTNIIAQDAQFAFLITLGMYSPTYVERCAADCDASGTVTAGDAQAIFNIVLFGGSCADPLPTMSII